MRTPSIQVLTEHQCTSEFICVILHTFVLEMLTLRSYGLSAYEIFHYFSFRIPFYTLGLIMKAV